MGHRVGHICLASGLASGADVILLPEIPYDIKGIVKAIKERQKKGQNYAVIACAEGAISKEDSLLTKKKYKAKVASRNGMSVAYEVAKELEGYLIMRFVYRLQDMFNVVDNLAVMIV